MLRDNLPVSSPRTNSSLFYLGRRDQANRHSSSKCRSTSDHPPLSSYLSILSKYLFLYLSYDDLSFILSFNLSNIQKHNKTQTNGIFLVDHPRDGLQRPREGRLRPNHQIEHLRHHGDTRYTGSKVNTIDREYYI